MAGVNTLQAVAMQKRVKKHAERKSYILTPALHRPYINQFLGVNDM